MKRDENGRFLKGTVPNPKGRPKKKKPVTLADVLDGKEKELLKRYVERAEQSDVVLVDLVERILKQCP